MKAGIGYNKDSRTLIAYFHNTLGFTEHRPSPYTSFLIPRLPANENQLLRRKEAGENAGSSSSGHPPTRFVCSSWRVDHLRQGRCVGIQHGRRRKISQITIRARTAFLRRRLRILHLTGESRVIFTKRSTTARARVSCAARVYQVGFTANVCVVVFVRER